MIEARSQVPGQQQRVIEAQSHVPGQPERRTDRPWDGRPLLGMIFPWLLARHATTAGTGRLYAVNTAGAVSGALVAGFVLLPQIGSTRTSWLAGLAVLATAVLVERTRRSLAWACAACLLGLGVASRYHQHAARDRVQGTGAHVYDQVPFHLLAPTHMMAIVTSFQAESPYTRLWMDPVSTTGILIGGDEPWELRSPLADLVGRGRSMPMPATIGSSGVFSGP